MLLFFWPFVIKKTAFFPQFKKFEKGLNIRLFHAKIKRSDKNKKKYNTFRRFTYGMV